MTLIDYTITFCILFGILGCFVLGFQKFLDWVCEKYLKK